MRTRKAPLPALVAICLTCLLLSACGPKMIRGEPPYVSIQGIELTDEQMKLRLRIRNINDVAIETTRIRFDIELEAEPLASYDQARSSSIIASGSETLSFDFRPSESGRALLLSLQNREVPNLEYSITGEIDALDEPSLSFSGEGRIYPVPGRPGQFR